MAERTLLQMVNSVRQKLRGGDPLTSLPSGDSEVDTAVGLINDAASDILGRRKWSFLNRDDGRAVFPPKFTGTGMELDRTVGGHTLKIPSPTGDQDRLMTENVVMRFRSLEDSIIPNTSAAIATIVYSGIGPHYTVVTTEAWWGDEVSDATSTWDMFAYEHVLPATVGQVLSVRHEETPLALEFEERYVRFDHAVPRPQDSFAIPEVAVVGGLAATTEDSGGTQRYGVRMAVWPIPSAQTMLRYSYTYVPAALSAGTDVLTGVYENVVRLIEWRAVELAMASTEKDPEQYAPITRVVAQMYAAAIESDKRAPARRLIPRSFGTGSVGSYRSRWADQTVTDPYA